MNRANEFTEPVTVRRVSSSELEQLSEISRKTFLDSFGDLNTKENMDLYLDKAMRIDVLAQELENAQSEFYFSLLGDLICGYLKLNYGDAQTEFKGRNSVEIERIYVLKEFQGRKIGQVFVDLAIQKAKSNHAEFLWLGVWEKNIRAIDFYKRQGFHLFGEHDFYLGKEKQTDLLLKLFW
ncbi:MAG: GNAT family N-acetyltransferase [Saprospiraceae bacterium]|nr:GNAT family N-acetyltransferase [Saprospiraceae bacterium]